MLAVPLVRMTSGEFDRWPDLWMAVSELTPN
jgi:hypothetical protein